MNLPKPNLDETIQKLELLLSSALNVENIPVACPVGQILDSFDTLNFLMIIESEFEVKLPEECFYQDELQTIGFLSEVLVNLQTGTR